jgi:hypothetical protein
MAWYRFHTPLIRHRKVIKLARTLKIKPVHAVGHLTFLWAHVLEMAETGDISKWSVDDIATFAGWEGNPQEFYKALVNNGDGFLDVRRNKVTIHDWWNGTGAYLKAKYRTSNPVLYDKLKTDFSQTKNGLKTAERRGEEKRGERGENTQFNELWEKYPEKIGRKGALRHFENTVKTAEDFALITKALDNYRGSARVAKGYIQNATTWFNNWKDWVDNPEPKKQEGSWGR